MSRISEDPFVKELASNVGVDRSDDQCRDEDESESRLPCPGFGEGTDDGCSGVLTRVLVPDSGGDAEEDDFHPGESSEGFGEIGGVAHLGNEGGVENLADPEEGDAAES